MTVPYEIKPLPLLLPRLAVSHRSYPVDLETWTADAWAARFSNTISWITINLADVWVWGVDRRQCDFRCGVVLSPIWVGPITAKLRGNLIRISDTAERHLIFLWPFGTWKTFAILMKTFRLLSVKHPQPERICNQFAGLLNRVVSEQHLRNRSRSNLKL